MLQIFYLALIDFRYSCEYSPALEVLSELALSKRVNGKSCE